MMGTYKVLLVDDNRTSILVLKSLLKTNPCFKIVGTGCNGNEAICLARKENPDVILMDCDMPVLNGIQATKTILQESPNIKIVFVSTNEEQKSQMFEVGALGYIAKGEIMKKLIPCILSIV